MEASLPEQIRITGKGSLRRRMGIGYDSTKKDSRADESVNVTKPTQSYVRLTIMENNFELWLMGL